jgi:Zn-finger domain-containing protein
VEPFLFSIHLLKIKSLKHESRNHFYSIFLSLSVAGVQLNRLSKIVMDALKNGKKINHGDKTMGHPLSGRINCKKGIA